MKFTCSNCKFWCELEHWTYHDDGGVDKEFKDEHCCTQFADSDAVVIHMDGTDSNDTGCERFTPREVTDEE